jgi:hypothetical protein
MSPEVKPDSLLNAEGLRFDGRRIDELRPIQMEVGVLHTADGSASIRQGKTYMFLIGRDRLHLVESVRFQWSLQMHYNLCCSWSNIPRL